MVKFDELSINKDSTLLRISASIRDLEYYENVFIDTISIDTQDTFTEEGPSNTPIYTNTLKGNHKSITLELNQKDLGKLISSNMFFVWVTTKTDPITEILGDGNSTIMRVAVSMYPVYIKSMAFIEDSLTNNKISSKFIDSILRLKAFKLSIVTKKYRKAIEYWKKFYNFI